MKSRAIAALLVSSLFLIAGCKTGDDAKAAATQLTATAKCLADYYTALDTILAESDQLNAVEQVMYGVPYDDATKAEIADTRAEIKKRAALAKGLSDLAESFAKLTGSSATTDASASAASLAKEVNSLQPTKGKLSSDEQTGMKAAVGLIVTAIEEHKEREAARGMDQLTKSLHDFFVKEEPDYRSIGDQYAVLSSSLAVSLLKNGQTDPAGFFKVALDPYGLTPQITDLKLRDGIEKLAEQQVAAKQDALKAAQKQATADMEKSLQQMSDRIDLVASEKPMELRIAPLSIANVEKWSAEFQSAAGLNAPDTASSKSKDATKNE
jgi:restriction endonuclease